MLNIARWTMAHRRIVVLAWIVAAVGIFAVSSSVGKKNASNFTLPGTGSQHAVDLLKSRFPAQAGDADQIVFQARTGTLNDATDRATIGTTLARVARLPHVTSVASPYAPGGHTISRDGTIGFATVNFDQRADVLPKAAVKGSSRRPSPRARRPSRSSSAAKRSSRPSRPHSGSRRSWASSLRS